MDTADTKKPDNSLSYRAFQTFGGAGGSSDKLTITLYNQTLKYVLKLRILHISTKV
jgi:hypothetical protein